MARSSDANNMPEGITFVFGSWACLADRLGGFSSHLVTPNSPKPKAIIQSADVCEITNPNRKRVVLELSSDSPENVPTPTRTIGSVEFETNSDSEKSQFFETLEKYLTHLKSIKRPKINNSELLEGVDRVSRSIEGCIKLAESAFSSSKP